MQYRHGQKNGRVGASKSYDVKQMKATIKATKQFLKNETSRVAGVKQYTKKVSTQAGKKVSYKKVNALFQAEKHYEWIYDYFADTNGNRGKSFWNFAREFKNVDFETWCDNIMVYITDRSLDTKLKKDLRALYNYAKGVNG